MQEKQHGEEDTRVVGKSRPLRNLVVLTAQPALSVAEFKFRITKPGNTGESCLKFRHYKHGETCCKGFELEQRANFSCVPGRSGHGRKHGETCGRTSRASHQQKFGLPQPSRIVRKLDVCLLVCGLLCTSTSKCSPSRNTGSTVWRMSKCLDWGLSPWRSCTIVHDNNVKRLKAKVSVFSDSQCHASAVNSQNIHDLRKHAQKKLTTLSPLLYIVSWTTTLVSWSCSSGRFSQCTQHWIHSKKSKS